MNYPATTRLSRLLMTSKTRCLGDGLGAVYLTAAFVSAVDTLRVPLGAAVSRNGPAAHD